MLQDAKNSQLMVVVNQAHQFDYLLRGIMWEVLPINIIELERVKIIRTFSTIFFGTTTVIDLFAEAVQAYDLKVNVDTQASVLLQNLQESR